MKGAGMDERRGGHQIVRTKAGWHVRTVAGNGEILATSETFTTGEAANVNLAAQVMVAKRGWVQEVDERELICTECGNDLAAEGETRCTDCLEAGL
jgi:uncharacterized protein YegP (UPF0339 family)